MKQVFTTILFLSLHLLAIGQLPFAPLGATWRSHYECATNPVMELDYVFTVTEDTVIQGKYCTRLRDDDWICTPNTPTYVHYENGKVYRYDIEQGDFQLIIDYTKQVEETWRIKVCPDYFGADSATVLVTISDGIFRRVFIMVDGGSFDFDRDLYEGVGAIRGYPLFFSSGDFISSEPPCWTLTTCYQDPDLGIVYGDGANGSCMVSSDEEARPAAALIKLYANPVREVLRFGFAEGVAPSGVASFRILNVLGQVVAQLEASRFQETMSVPVEGWATGLYFLQYLEAGTLRHSETFIKH